MDGVSKQKFRVIETLPGACFSKHIQQGFNRRLDGWMHGDLLTLESEDQQAMGKDGLEALYSSVAH